MVLKSKFGSTVLMVLKSEIGLWFLVLGFTVLMVLNGEKSEFGSTKCGVLARRSTYSYFAVLPISSILLIFFLRNYYTTVALL